MGKLTGVTKQLVSGMLYTLTYENDAGDVYQIAVHIQSWMPRHVQSVTIVKNPWLK